MWFKCNTVAWDISKCVIPLCGLEGESLGPPEKGTLLSRVTEVIVTPVAHSDSQEQIRWASQQQSINYFKAKLGSFLTAVSRHYTQKGTVAQVLFSYNYFKASLGDRY